jgi:Mediator complex subunit 29
MPMGPMQMNPGLQPGGLQSPMQQSPANLQQVQMQQAQMQAQQQQQQQEKLDNISKVKTLVGPLKESLSVCIHIILSNIFLFSVLLQNIVKYINNNYVCMYVSRNVADNLIISDYFEDCCTSSTPKQFNRFGYYVSSLIILEQNEFIKPYLFLCSKGNESTTQRFDKNLEEFYSYCDQMELNLVRNILQTTHTLNL